MGQAVILLNKGGILKITLLSHPYNRYKSISQKYFFHKRSSPSSPQLSIKASSLVHCFLKTPTFLYTISKNNMEEKRVGTEAGKHYETGINH
jgi:hypothetical protein